MDATESKSSASRGNSPRRFTSALLGLLQGHIELFVEELKEQQGRTVTLLLLTGLSLLFALMLLFGLSTAVLIAFWDSHRLLVIIGLCLFYTLGLLSCVFSLVQRIRHAPTPFSASMEELARDREQLLP